jgi:hypothetical protein
MNENNFSPKILCPAKLSFKMMEQKNLPQYTGSKTKYDPQATTTLLYKEF